MTNFWSSPARPGLSGAGLQTREWWYLQRRAMCCTPQHLGDVRCAQSPQTECSELKPISLCRAGSGIPARHTPPRNLGEPAGRAEEWARGGAPKTVGAQNSAGCHNHMHVIVGKDIELDAVGRHAGCVCVGGALVVWPGMYPPRLISGYKLCLKWSQLIEFFYVLYVFITCMSFVLKNISVTSPATLQSGL